MKKFLAMLLTVGLVISMIPGIAFAEEEQAEAVAQIGEEKYSTLQEAFSVAKDGSKIILLADVNEEITIDHKSHYNITLDLSGFSLGRGYPIKNVTSYLTIQDSSVGQTGQVDASIELDGGNTTWKSSKLTILSGTFTGDIVAGNKGTLCVKGGTIDGEITKNSGTVVCTGGFFKVKPGNDMLEIGYLASEEPIDGYYQVEADKAAQIGNTTYSTLKQALTKAKDGDTVRLLKDQINIRSINYYEIDKSIILDLNGKTISTPSNKTIYVNKYGETKNITIKNGTIRNTNTSGEPSMGIVAEQRVNLTLENVTLEAVGFNSYGIFINPQNNAVQPTITVKGDQTKISGNIAGLAVNGYSKDVGATTLIVEGGTIEGGRYGVAGNGEQHNTNITVNGGTINGGSCGIFNPQDGKLNISGGTIEGATGVELRAGELNVTGNPVITATGAYTSNSNDSGSTSTGVGIAVAQHTTKLPISVNISGGTIKGVRALDETNPENNPEESISKVSIEVTDGSFVGDVCAVDVSKFISGGIYSADPTGFVDDNSYAYKMNAKYIVASEGYQVANWVFEKDVANDKLYIGTYHPPYIPPAPVDPITNTGSASSESATTNADISKDPASTTEQKTEIMDDKTEVTTTTIKIAPDTAEKIAQRAIQHSSAHIIIDATTGKAGNTAAGNKTEVVLPATTILTLAENTAADVVIKSDIAEITLDAKAVNAVAAQTSGEIAANDTVIVVAQKVKDESNEMRFDLKVVTPNGSVLDFDGGDVLVKVQLNDQLKTKEYLTCLYIDDFGWFSRVEGARNADGAYTFVTGHFSAYAIMEERDADKLIKKQVSLTKGVQNTTIKLTSTLVTKGIKLKWKKSKGFKVDKYQVYRAAKKNGKYSKIYLTKKGTTTSVVNGKNLKKGKRYFYKVRGVRTIAGKTFYTKWSNRTYRIYR